MGPMSLLIQTRLQKKGALRALTQLDLADTEAFLNAIVAHSRLLAEKLRHCALSVVLLNKIQLTTNVELRVSIPVFLVYAYRATKRTYFITLDATAGAVTQG